MYILLNRIFFTIWIAKIDENKQTFTRTYLQIWGGITGYVVCSLQFCTYIVSFIIFNAYRFLWSWTFPGTAGTARFWWMILPGWTASSTTLIVRHLCWSEIINKFFDLWGSTAPDCKLPRISLRIGTKKMCMYINNSNSTIFWLVLARCEKSEKHAGPLRRHIYYEILLKPLNVLFIFTLFTNTVHFRLPYMYMEK